MRQIVSCLVLLTSGCSMFVGGEVAAYRIEQRTLAEPFAAHHREHAKNPPVWSHPIPADGADELAFLSDDVVLVAEVKLGGEYGAFYPRPSRLTALRVSDGSLVWQRERKDGERVLRAGPGLWLSRRSPAAGKGEEPTCALLAVDPASGEDRAQVEVPCRTSPKVSPDGRLVVVFADTSVAAVDVEQGRVAWRLDRKLTFGGFGEGRLYAYSMPKDLPRVWHAVDLASGREVYAVPLPIAASSERALGGGRWLLARAFGVDPGSVAVVGPDGKVEWAWTPDPASASEGKNLGWIRAALRAGDVDLVLFQRGLLGFRAGALAFMRRFDGLANSVPVVASSSGRSVALVTVTTRLFMGYKPDQLLAIDVRTGEISLQLDLPDASTPHTWRIPPIFDLFAPRGQDLALLRGAAAVPVDLKGGRLGNARLWRGAYFASRAGDETPHIEGSDVFGHVASAQAMRLELRGEGLLELGKQLSKTPAGGPAGRPLFASPATQSQAMANYGAATAGALVGTLGAAQDAAAVGAAMREASRGNRTSAGRARLEWQRGWFTALGLRGTQGPLLVRPLAWSFGQGFLVVDLERDRFLEVVTGGPEHLVADYLLGIGPFAISPRGDRLVTLGLPPDPADWQPGANYVNFGAVSRAVLAFDLAPERFAPLSSYPQDSVTGDGLEVELGGFRMR